MEKRKMIEVPEDWIKGLLRYANRMQLARQRCTNNRSQENISLVLSTAASFEGYASSSEIFIPEAAQEQTGKE